MCVAADLGMRLAVVKQNDADLDRLLCLTAVMMGSCLGWRIQGQGETPQTYRGFLQ